MKSAVTGKQRPAVNHLHFPVRKHVLQPLPYHLIFLRTGTRHEHSTIDNQEIGIRTRQSVVIQIQCIRQWQRNQFIRLAIQSPQRLQLFFHRMQFRVILIRLILALSISYRIRRAETRQYIHVTVSIIARDTAMFQPNHPLQPERLLEFPLNLLLLKILVPVQ